VKLYVFTDFQYAELSPPPNKMINETKHSLVGGGVGVGLYLTGDKSLLLSLVHSYQQNLYFRAATVTALIVDKIALPDLEARVNYVAYKGPTFSVSAEVGAMMYFSIVTDTQKFRNGYGAFGRVFGSYDLAPATQLLLGGGALYCSHNTALIDQTRTEFTAFAGINLFLD
jgi:hypothetical protein